MTAFEQIEIPYGIYWSTPFTKWHVNDIVFAREFGFPVEQMNNYGCSLVWGHPQGPTALRSIIELIEELVVRGSGYGLFTGCAAGDSSMAVVIQVTSRETGTR